MNSGDFINLYRIPILKHLIQDEEFPFFFYYRNNQINVNPYSSLKTSNAPIKPKSITRIELKEFISEDTKGRSTRFLSDNYIYSEDDIDYIKSNLKNLNSISKAKGILWSDSLIDKYKDDWNWSYLSKNDSIIWTKNRIKNFENYIDFARISYNYNLKIDEYILQRYENKWDWHALSGNRAVATQIENELLEHSSTVWKIEKKVKYADYRVSYNLKYLNDAYVSYDEDRYLVKPSISSNPQIRWNAKKFNIYESKIDLWMLALFGNIDRSLIFEISEHFNENRYYERHFKRYSDWHYELDIYRNGWQNLMLNQQINIDIFFLKFLNNKFYTNIEYEGDYREGYTSCEVQRKVSDLILGERLNLDFSDLYINEPLIPRHLMSDTKIDQYLYEKSIKPVFIENEKLIRDIVYAFLYI